MADEQKVTKFGAGEQVTTLNADDRIPIGDGTGKQFYIKKADFAKVVLELLPTVTVTDKGLMPIDAFMQRGLVTSANVDAALDSGIYWHGSAILPYANTSYGMLIVFRASPKYITQIDVNLNADIFIRTCRIDNNNNLVVDKAWRRLSTSAI